nr:NADH dehydrogenase subunit 2 [Pennella sp. (in: crustaceans)]
MHNILSSMSLNLFSVFLCMGSSSFFSFWVSLELSSFSFVLLFRIFSPRSGVFLLKYFLIQGVTSSFFVWAYFNSISEGMVVALVAKMGLAPFHSWVLPLVENMNWDCWFIFMVMQKMVPIMFLTKILISSIWSQGLAFLNILISCCCSFHLSSLRSLMFYSSLFNMAWVLLALPSVSGALLVFFMYCFIMWSVWSVLSSVGILYLQQTYMLKEFSGEWMLTLINLMGFPPGAGFLIKWVVAGLSYFSLPLLVLMLISSLWMIYIYMGMFMYMTFSFKISSIYSSLRNKMLSLSHLSANLLMAMVVFINVI